MCDRNALEREKEKKKVQFEKDTSHWQFFLERHWVIDKVSKSWGGEGRVTLRWTVISLTREEGRSVAVILIA